MFQQKVTSFITLTPKVLDSLQRGYDEGKGEEAKQGAGEGRRGGGRRRGTRKEGEGGDRDMRAVNPTCSQRLPEAKHLILYKSRVQTCHICAIQPKPWS